MGVDVLRVLAEAEPSQDSGVELRERLTLVLADYIACIRAGDDPAEHGASPDGTSGRAAATARAGSVRDLDDVDWRSMHHPGSVVWPVVLALSGEVRAGGSLLEQAAWSGYATAATVADLLGTEHRAVWHVTATAGALGAAHAGAVMLGLSPERRARAMALAAANAGGLVQAARERGGAAVFNRIAAVTLGLASARAAAWGAVPIRHSFEDMCQAMSASDTPGPVLVRDGILDAAPRIYPVSGFLQSAVAGAAECRTFLGGDLSAVTLGLPPGALSLVDGDGAGPWWDARLAALRAWAHADPYASSAPSAVDGQRDRVRLEARELPPGSASLVVRTDAGSHEIDCVEPPTFAASGAWDALRSKCQRVLNVDPDAPYEIACRALGDSGPDYEAEDAWWTR